MATMYQVTVTNNSPDDQDFFFFQKPAVYSGGPEVYTNSIANGQIQGGGTSQLQFLLELQYYAGVQTQPKPIKVGVANLDSISAVPIDIASPTDPNAKDLTNMIISGGLGLSTAVNSTGVEEGAFRIVIPTFNPANSAFNAGLAAYSSGNIVLSNFVVAEPTKYLDVQPIVTFYVATGNFTPGTVVDFTSSSQNSAVCDATNGQEDFQVSYNADGSWTVA